MMPLNHRSMMNVVPIAARQSEKGREDHGAEARDEVAHDVRQAAQRLTP